MLLIKRGIAFLSLFVLLSPTIFSCSSNNNDYIYLKILNSEDYIYKYSEEGDLPDLTVQFENDVNNYSVSKYGKKVKVIYDTFDTMENMYNTLETGKTKYDLICASEYMIQKLTKNNYIKKITNHDGSYDGLVDNYEKYGSKFIRNKFKNIKYGDNEKYVLDDYCLCYMWGTLGIIYNPTFDTFKSKGYTKEEVINDMNTYDSLWGDNNNGKYKKTIAIKDSMRDTYAIGLIHKYLLNHDDYTLEQRQKIFNYGGEDDVDAKNHVNEIKNDLLKLRENIFGFEVDSGKEDIVTGKIGIDTAWSGDAVHSINEAENEKNIKLYYSLPKEGANLWFDCWCMQENDEVHQDIAYKFLNFISDPENAKQNMDYIGYTSSIAGSTFDYYKEKYKVKESGSEGTSTYDLSYFFKTGSDDNDDYTLTVDSSYLNRQLTAQFPPSDYQNDKLMVMKDYGKNNDLILKLWEEVKHEYLPVWAIVIFVIEIIAIIALILYFVIKKIKDKKLRKSLKISLDSKK